MGEELPTTYDSGVSVSTTNRVDGAYITSLNGILRMVECLVALIAFICAAVGQSGWGLQGAAGWCMFVSMFSFIVFFITFFLWLFKVFPSPRIPIRFSEFVGFVAFAVMYLIAGIVAAAFGGRHTGMAAAAFFNFAMLVLCCVDAFFHNTYWRSSNEGPNVCGNTGGGGGSGAQSSGGATSAENPSVY